MNVHRVTVSIQNCYFITVGQTRVRITSFSKVDVVNLLTDVTLLLRQRERYLISHLLTRVKQGGEDQLRIL